MGVFIFHALLPVLDSASHSCFPEPPDPPTPMGSTEPSYPSKVILPSLPTPDCLGETGRASPPLPHFWRPPLGSGCSLGRRWPGPRSGECCRNSLGSVAWPLALLCSMALPWGQGRVCGEWGPKESIGTFKTATDSVALRRMGPCGKSRKLPRLTAPVTRLTFWPEKVDAN